MTIQTSKRLLMLLTVALLGLSGGVIALPNSSWIDLQNLISVTEFAQEAPRIAEKGALSPGCRLAANHFQTYWSRPLRRPLYDPPPPPPPPPKVVEIPPPRPIAATLLATMVEPQNSMAMLRLSSGETVFRKVGEEIGASDVGALISSIEEGVVNVERDKQITKLTVPGKKGL